MGTLKKFGPSAVLAVAGVKASEAANITDWRLKLLAAVVGAGIGLIIASKIGGKAKAAA